MKFIIFYISAIIIYITIITLIILKIKDINNHPTKYENKELEIKGNNLERTKNYCRFFKSLSHEYSFLPFLFVFILTFIMYVIFSFISNVVFIGNLKSLNVGSPLISTIPAFFFNIVFGMIVIPLWIKTPFFEVAIRDMFNVFGRVAINRRAYKVLLFIFLITFPVMTQPLTYYYGYNENGIYYSEFFEFNESFVSYEDIDQVNIYFSHNNSGKINSFNYEIVFNNKKKNINKPNSGIKYCSEETLEVHEYIIKNNENIIFNITPLNEEDIKIIEEKMNIKNKEILYYLFSLNE